MGTRPTPDPRSAGARRRSRELVPERRRKLELEQPNVFLDLCRRPAAHEDRADAGVTLRELDGRGGQGNVPACADLAEADDVRDDVRGGRLVVERVAAGEDAAVEDAARDYPDAALLAERQEFRVRRPVEHAV